MTPQMELFSSALSSISQGFSILIIVTVLCEPKGQMDSRLASATLLGGEGVVRTYTCTNLVASNRTVSKPPQVCDHVQGIALSLL